MNVCYIPQLTDEPTEEYNVNQYMSLYLLVPIPRLSVTDEYSEIYYSVTHIWDSPLHRVPSTCLYIPRLTEEYRVIRPSVNQGIYWFF
jgi:hypothetical protein